LEVSSVLKNPNVEKLSVYIPQNKLGQKPVERLIALGDKRDRSINYLVVEAILQYIQREEDAEKSNDRGRGRPGLKMRTSLRSPSRN
jgi:hypothetical protein